MIKLSCDNPLSQRIACRSGLDEGEIGDSCCGCAIAASCQELSVGALQGPFSVRLHGCSPPRERACVGGQMSEGWVCGSRWIPTVITHWQPKSIRSLKSNFSPDSGDVPLLNCLIHCIVEAWLHTYSIVCTASNAKLQVITVISSKSLNSNRWQVSIRDCPLGPRLGGIALMNKSKVSWKRVRNT